MVAIRGPFSVFGGALLAAMLFLGLAQLVSVPFEVPPLQEVARINFTRQIIESVPVTRREPRVEREPPLVEPGPPRLGGVERSGGIGSVPFTRLVVDTGTAGRRGIGLRGVDGDVNPVVRQKPEYPPRALSSGTEGWVQVQFSVTAIGTVRDAVVVASEPDTIFDEAALKAIARWRYNPRVESGEAVERVGLQTIIRFELEN
jgi:protein TonB